MIKAKLYLVAFLLCALWVLAVPFLAAIVIAYELASKFRAITRASRE
jgi:hypothetical protein